MRMATAGWDYQQLQLVTKEGERPELAAVNVLFNEHSPQLQTKRKEILAAAGFSATVERDGPPAAHYQWTALTHFTPWMCDRTHRRWMVAIGSNDTLCQRVTAGFIYDVWRTHSFEDNEERIPRFARFNLLSWMSPDALRTWPEVTKGYDIVVVYGGFYNEAKIHEVLGYLQAMSASFPGMLLYEMTISPGMTLPRSMVANYANKAGAAMTVSYNTKNMTYYKQVEELAAAKKLNKLLEEAVSK